MAAPAMTAIGTSTAYTLRSCVGRRRWLLSLLPAGGAVLLGLLAHAIDDPADAAFARVAADGVFALVVPITSLVIGDAVLGAEIRAGVFHFTWLSPAPLTPILLGRWAGGTMAAIAALVPACALGAVVAGSPSNVDAVVLAAAAGAMAYIAVFVVIGSVARRAAVWSLGFVFLVERLLGTALSGIAQWSPTWESRAVFVGLASDAPTDLERSGIPAGGDGLVRLVVITAIALALARWRLPRLRLTGASD